MLRIFLYGDYALRSSGPSRQMERVSAITSGFGLAVDNLDAVLRARPL